MTLFPLDVISVYPVIDVEECSFDEFWRLLPQWLLTCTHLTQPLLCRLTAESMTLM